MLQKDGKILAVTKRILANQRFNPLTCRSTWHIYMDISMQDPHCYPAEFGESAIQSAHMYIHLTIHSISTLLLCGSWWISISIHSHIDPLDIYSILSMHIHTIGCYKADPDKSAFQSTHMQINLTHIQYYPCIFKTITITKWILANNWLQNKDFIFRCWSWQPFT